MLSYILYEDVLSFRLNPLVRLMPVFSLRTCGLELHQVWSKHLDNDAIALCTRNLLSERTEELFTDIPVNTLPSDEFIAINARLLPDYMSRAAIESLQVGQVIVCQDVPMAARLSVDQSDALINTSEGWFIDTDNLNILRNDELQVIRFAWDLPGYVDSMLTIERDHLDFVPLTNQLLGVHFINPENIYIHPNAIVMPGCVLNATDGPIIIHNKAKVMANGYLEGPLSVGEGSTIKAGARIYEGSVIGPICKVGGEIENSIFHSFSNKQHEGFLGHSVVGKWVNLGADTNNSDLKNNYGHVKSWSDGHQVDTEKMFVGLTIGDHSKSGINTMFNTGTVVGIMSNVFGSGFPPTYIPDFSWGGAESIEQYKLEKGIEVAERVTSRRNVTLTNAEKKLLAHWFSLSKTQSHNIES